MFLAHDNRVVFFRKLWVALKRASCL